MRTAKISIIALLAAMLALAIAPTASAEFLNLTLNAPADSAVISGTSVLLNATTNVTGTTAANVTFQVRCTDTINSSYNTINITTNTTTNQFTTRFDSTTVEDSAICEVKAFAGGNDTGSFTDTNNLIRVDNTVSTTPTNPARAVLRTDTVSINITVTSTNTVRCRLTFQGTRPADNAVTDINNVSESSGVCLFSFTKYEMPDGIYTYLAFATDNTNETAAAGTGEIEISRAQGSAAKAGYGQAIVAEAQAQKSKNLTTIIIAGLALYGLYWYTRKK